MYHHSYLLLVYLKFYVMCKVDSLWAIRQRSVLLEYILFMQSSRINSDLFGIIRTQERKTIFLYLNSHWCRDSYDCFVTGRKKKDLRQIHCLNKLHLNIFPGNSSFNFKILNIQQVDFNYFLKNLHLQLHARTERQRADFLQQEDFTLRRLSKQRF